MATRRGPQQNTSAGPAAVSQPRPGLRERNKADKLARIKVAARELFLERGYGETTIREVAMRADVGQGTVFAYAAEKRDLVFLIVNDEYEKMLKEALAAIDPDGMPLDNLLIIFRHALAFVQQQGVIGRQMLRELTFHSSSTQPPHERRFDAIRLDFLTKISAVIDRAQQHGRLTKCEDSAWITRVAFAIYRSEVRAWLSEPDPVLEEGYDNLRRSLTLLFRGLTPSGHAPA